MEIKKMNANPAILQIFEFWMVQTNVRACLNILMLERMPYASLAITLGRFINVV